MASHQILAGFHAVTARLRHDPDSIKEIYIETDEYIIRNYKNIKELYVDEKVLISPVASCTIKMLCWKFFM